MTSVGIQTQHTDNGAKDAVSEIPMLKKQNFTLGRTLSILCLLITLLYIAGTIVNSLMMYGLLEVGEKQLEITVMLSFLLALLAIFQLLSTIGIFAILNKYLLNFNFGNKVRTFVKGIIISSILLTIVGVIAQIPTEQSINPLPNPLVLGALVVLLLTVGVFCILAGWRLFRFKGDYVGGLSSLGLIMWLAIPLPILWPIVPVMTFIVFSKADKYAYDHGVEGEK